MKKPTGARPSGGSRGSSVFVPDVGDLVWFSFSPVLGREQAGRRPALVLSPRSYNARTGLCLVCPITGKSKGYPFEVELPGNLPIQGVVLSDHVKSADWQAEYIGTSSSEVLQQVRAKLRPFLGM